jgi:hypothetical protein
MAQHLIHIQEGRQAKFKVIISGLWAVQLIHDTIFIADVTLYADPSSRAVWGVDLRQIGCWDHGFYSRSGHG